MNPQKVVELPKLPRTTDIVESLKNNVETMSYEAVLKIQERTRAKVEEANRKIASISQALLAYEQEFTQRQAMVMLSLSGNEKSDVVLRQLEENMDELKADRRKVSASIANESDVLEIARNSIYARVGKLDAKAREAMYLKWQNWPLEETLQEARVAITKAVLCLAGHTTTLPNSIGVSGFLRQTLNEDGIETMVDAAKEVAMQKMRDLIVLKDNRLGTSSKESK